jgi:hypothetical protein
MYPEMYSGLGKQAPAGMHVDEMLSRMLGGRATWMNQMPLPGALNSWLGAQEYWTVVRSGFAPGTRIIGIDLIWLP